MSKVNNDQKSSIETLKSSTKYLDCLCGIEEYVNSMITLNAELEQKKHLESQLVGNDNPKSIQVTRAYINKAEKRINEIAQNVDHIYQKMRGLLTDAELAELSEQILITNSHYNREITAPQYDVSKFIRSCPTTVKDSASTTIIPEGDFYLRQDVTNPNPTTYKYTDVAKVTDFTYGLIIDGTDYVASFDEEWIEELANHLPPILEERYKQEAAIYLNAKADETRKVAERLLGSGSPEQANQPEQRQ